MVASLTAANLSHLNFLCRPILRTILSPMILSDLHLKPAQFCDKKIRNVDNFASQMPMAGDISAPWRVTTRKQNVTFQALQFQNTGVYQNGLYWCFYEVNFIRLVALFVQDEESNKRSEALGSDRCYTDRPHCLSVQEYFEVFHMIHKRYIQNMTILNRLWPKTEEIDTIRLMVVDSLLVFHSSDHASHDVKSHRSFLRKEPSPAVCGYARHQQDGYTVPPKFVALLYKDSAHSASKLHANKSDTSWRNSSSNNLTLERHR